MSEFQPSYNQPSGEVDVGYGQEYTPESPGYEVWGQETAELEELDTAPVLIAELGRIGLENEVVLEPLAATVEDDIDYEPEPEDEGEDEEELEDQPESIDEYSMPTAKKTDSEQFDWMDEEMRQAALGLIYIATGVPAHDMS